MRGLTLQITNVSTIPLSFPDIAGMPVLAVGASQEILYLDAVQQSLESGSINGYVTAGQLTALFVSGTSLNQAPIGRTFVGATPTSNGGTGLVPAPPIPAMGNFLKGDGTWSGVTAQSIGAIGLSILTAQGDILYRGITQPQRLPIGSLGQTLRSGPVNPQWESNTLAGTGGSRPSPGPLYAGTFYWTTDTSHLYLCYYNGSGYEWNTLGEGGGSPIFVVQQSDSSSDIDGDTQLWANTLDGGLYSKPNGLPSRRVDLPGLSRKSIPSPEAMYIPDGSQYICHGTFTLQGSASITLEGDADLVVL